MATNKVKAAQSAPKAESGQHGKSEKYKSCRGGSRKAQVRMKFDQDGREAALILGKSLGLVRLTVISWIAGG